MFKRKTKKEEIVQPEDVPEAEEPEEQLPKPPKETTEKKKRPTEPKGKFSLDMEEMAIFAQLAAGSEEYKIYHQGLVGQKLDKIVAEYNKAVGEKSEVHEDTGEEKLPE